MVRQDLIYERSLAHGAGDAHTIEVVMVKDGDHAPEAGPHQFRNVDEYQKDVEGKEGVDVALRTYTYCVEDGLTGKVLSRAVGVALKN